MRSLNELEEIRKKVLDKVALRKAAGGVRVVVGMATCGIAAGAQPVMNTFIEEISKRGIANTSVTMTGCIGACRLEPIVEIFQADGKRTTYVKMTPEKARQVVAGHLVNGRIVSEYTVGAED
ncbi:MAG TPA: ferredoxin [Clostridiales bacterium]|nr:ferredoxin [Clostridiales bacterium]